MQQMLNMWSALSPKRRAVVAFSTAAMFVAILGITRLAMTPSLTLLYAGLENGPAGEVVSTLEQKGVPYEVRGGAIYVEKAARDQLRMTLASEGLPANGNQGYELLDSLSGFGTTSQMFDAAYWRAKEGELARTIMASPMISSARVHIANGGSNPFRRDIRPSASVSVSSATGGIAATHAKALKYLVSSAVSGLSPEDVAIIDGSGTMIAAGDEPAKQADAEERAAVLRERVLRLVEARVGHGNAVVEVSVETVTDSESIRERLFDPEGRVAVSTDTEERSTQSTDTGGGDVTVASNLPDGDAAGGDSSSSQDSETRERVNYEVSETEREIIRAPGALKRMTVAVLINSAIVEGPDGTSQIQPLVQDQITALHDLVASAVGYDEARGDVITLRSMPFKPVATLDETAVQSAFARLALDMNQIVQLAVLSAVALILGLFVIRPILSRSGPNPLALPAADAPSGRENAPVESVSEPGLAALTGEIDDGPDSLDIPSGRDDRELPQIAPGTPADPVDRLRAMIGERQEETVEILKSWLDEKEEKA